MTNKMQAVIIAAGESSRFWPLNQGHKCQTCLLGKSLIYWTTKGLFENGVQDITVVCGVGSTIPEMLQRENDIGVSLRFVFQEKPLGTGNALWQAREFIKEPFFVVWPNKINSKELIAKMMEQKNAKGSDAVFAGAETLSPWDYGVAEFKGEQLVGIHENPEQGKEPSKIKIIGCYFFEPDFFDYYSKLSQHHEADFIEAVNLYLKNKKASVALLEKDAPALKYPWELLGIFDILLSSENFGHSISLSAQIGNNVTIKGQVHIGSNTKIQDNTVIEGPCFIGDNCVIGHSNVLRGPLNIENNVITGAFCEIKHSVVGEGCHIHSGFIGDSVIGKNCRIAAGFISANRRLDRGEINVVVKDKKINTGLTYLGVVIGENTGIGIHSGTMPGVLIGSNCVIGPGTQIFKNVPDGQRVFSKGSP